MPTDGTGDHFLRIQLRKVCGNRARMAMHMLFYGGTLHLSAAILQRLWTTVSASFH